MKLMYTDLTGEERIIEATITTDHAASSYGMPVIVLPDGEALDHVSAAAMNYRLVEATQEERELLAKWRRAMP